MVLLSTPPHASPKIRFLENGCLAMATDQKKNPLTPFAEFLGARRTGNQVVDREDNLKDANGVPKRRDPFETFRNVFGGRFTPPVEAPKVAALEPRRDLNPSLLPAMPDKPGLGGLATYIASQAHVARDVRTLFHAMPPTSVQFPRAVDSQNLPAVPPRFTMSSIYQVFNKPRRGTPGNNPMGVNNTPSL